MADLNNDIEEYRAIQTSFTKHYQGIMETFSEIVKEFQSWEKMPLNEKMSGLSLKKKNAFSPAISDPRNWNLKHSKLSFKVRMR